MNVLRVAALLIYTFGVYAYGTLLALWFREVRAARTARPEAAWAGDQTVFSSGALFAVSFVWFVTNLLIALQLLAPGRPGGWLWSASLWASLWLALAFPPLITHMVWAESRKARSAPPSRPWGFAVGVMYVLAGAVALTCTLGFSGIGGVSKDLANRLASIGTLGLFVGTAIYSIALLMRYPVPPRTIRDAQSNRWHIVMFALMALLFAFLFGLDRQSATATLVGGSLIIAARSLPLAFMFVGTYFEHRFEFFDIFVKRGLSLFATIGVFALSFAAVLPVLQQYAGTWAAPWVYAIVFLPLGMGCHGSMPGSARRSTGSGSDDASARSKPSNIF